MLKAERYKAILSEVALKDGIQVDDLAKHFRVSASTIRRDLHDLARQGLLSRVHGGATKARELANAVEPPRILRLSEHHSEKRRIGEAASRLVKDGDTIIIGAGTTTEAMVPFLRERQRLTVVTNSLGVITAIAQYPGISLLVLGGHLRHASNLMLDSSAEVMLNGLSIDKIFYGAYAVSAHSLMGGDVEETATDRLLISSGTELVVLADSSKFANRGPTRLTSVSRINTLITDTNAPHSVVTALKASGVAVIQC